MENNSNPPFAIGQKVVALRSSHFCSIRKGDIVTVADCFIRSCKCKRWTVSVKEAIGYADQSVCKHCYELYPHFGKHFNADAKYFAPIQRQTTEVEIEQEVLDSLPKITEERADILKPEKVNN